MIQVAQRLAWVTTTCLGQRRRWRRREIKEEEKVKEKKVGKM